MSDHIPEENLLEILKHLPVQSLLRFRCVCKRWKQLIDSPFFVLDHLSVQKPRLIAGCEEPEFLVLDPQTLPLFNTLPSPTMEGKPKQFHLIGTLHGIVCLYDNYYNICLWNPSICKFSIVVPLPERMRVHNWHPNPLFGIYSAFWIDPYTRNFKVVLFELISFASLLDYGAMYSSVEGGWKELDVGELFNRWPLKETPAVIIQGVAYWRAFFLESGPCGFNVIAVMYFDFQEERFDTIDGPFICCGLDSFDLVLCDWQGHLSLVLYKDVGCDVYLGQEDSWVKLFAVHLPSHIVRVLWVMSDMEERDGGQVGEMQESTRILATTSEDAMVLFDTRAGCVPLKSGLDDSDWFYVAHGFAESLLFP